MRVEYDEIMLHGLNESDQLRAVVQGDGMPYSWDLQLHPDMIEQVFVCLQEELPVRHDLRRGAF